MSNHCSFYRHNPQTTFHNENDNTEYSSEEQVYTTGGNFYLFIYLKRVLKKVTKQAESRPVSILNAYNLLHHFIQRYMIVILLFP